MSVEGKRSWQRVPRSTIPSIGLSLHQVNTILTFFVPFLPDEEPQLRCPCRHAFSREFRADFIWLHAMRSSSRSRRSASNTGGGNDSARRSASSGVRSRFAVPVPRNIGSPFRMAIISRRVRPRGASGQRPIRSWKSKNTGTIARMYFQYPGLSVCITKDPPATSERWTVAKNEGVISRR